MSFLKKVFHHRPSNPLIVFSEDDDMKRRIKEAKWRHSIAVNEFVEASNRQERDANLARQIVHDVLRRVESKNIAEFLGKKT